jgi:hypothetical protein
MTQTLADIEIKGLTPSTGCLKPGAFPFQPHHHRLVARRPKTSPKKSRNLPLI